MTHILFSGYDDRQASGFNVFAHSVWRLGSGAVDTIPLKHKTLRDKGIFKRPWKVAEDGQFVDLIDGKPFSTQFSHTRFLVPYIAKRLGLKGLVAFVDGNDFLCVGNPIRLFFEDEKEAKEYPVYCVKHDYTTNASVKMDGMTNATYPKKNWSSCMLFNLGHPDLDVLTPDYVNTVDGGQLHQFKWLPSDDAIGSLPESYNQLVGEDTIKKYLGTPVFLHYTKGIPIHKGYENGPLAWLWKNEATATRDWEPTFSIKLEEQL